VLYALTLGLASLSFTGLWACLALQPTLLTAAAQPRVRAALRRSLTGPSLYAIAGLIAMASAPASLAIDAAVALYFTLLPRHLRRATPTNGPHP